MSVSGKSSGSYNVMEAGFVQRVIVHPHTLQVQVNRREL